MLFIEYVRKSDYHGATDSAFLCRSFKSGTMQGADVGIFMALMYVKS